MEESKNLRMFSTNKKLASRIINEIKNINISKISLCAQSYLPIDSFCVIKNEENFILNFSQKQQEKKHFKNNTLLALDEDENVDYQKYYLLTSKIEKHLKNKDHSLKILKDIFTQNFLKNYSYLINCKEKIYEENEKIFKELITFLKIYEKSVCNFYNIGLFLKENSQNIENFYNFIICLIFSEEIYNFIFQIQIYLDEIFEKKLQLNYKIYENKNPQFFGVPLKFLTNFNQSKDIFFSEPIEILKEINNTINPIHKLKIIILLNEVIISKVLDIFQNQNIEINHNHINGDDFNYLLIYIISKSKIKNLISHINLIERFIIDKNSMVNYYYLKFKKTLQNFIQFEEEKNFNYFGNNCLNNTNKNPILTEESVSDFSEVYSVKQNERVFSNNI